MELHSLSPDAIKALKAEVECELARRDFLTFCKRVMPSFETPPHVVKIAERLQRVFDGESNRLHLACPPRTGKSTIATLAVAFYLGKYPERWNMIVTYGQDLSNGHSRKIRDIVTSEKWPFTNVRIRDDSRSVESWQVVQGGGVTAVGAGSAITGRDASGILLCDDLIKNESALDSAEKVEEFREWWGGTAYSRLERTSAIISIGTRWGLTDAQSIVLESGGVWDALSFPMESAGEGDALGRPAGELLWPERFPQEMIDNIKFTLRDRQYRALYMCDPVPQDGVILQASWLDNFWDGEGLPTVEYFVPSEYRPWALTPGGLRKVERPAQLIMAVDASWGQGTSSDYSAIAIVAFTGKEFIITDMWRGRVQHPELVRVIAQYFDRYQPRAVVIEAASAGFAAIQSLKYLNRIPVFPISPRSSKEARLESISVLFERGLVKFKRGAWWYPILRDELLTLPHGRNDDMADAVIYAILSIFSNTSLTSSLESGSAMSISQFKRYKREAM